MGMRKMRKPAALMDAAICEAESYGTPGQVPQQASRFGRQGSVACSLMLTMGAGAVPEHGVGSWAGGGGAVWRRCALAVFTDVGREEVCSNESSTASVPTLENVSPKRASGPCRREKPRQGPRSGAAKAPTRAHVRV